MQAHSTAMVRNAYMVGSGPWKHSGHKAAVSTSLGKCWEWTHGGRGGSTPSERSATWVWQAPSFASAHGVCDCPTRGHVWATCGQAWGRRAPSDDAPRAPDGRRTCWKGWIHPFATKEIPVPV